MAGESFRRLDVAPLIGTDFRRLPHVLRILFENAMRSAPVEETAHLPEAFRDWLEQGSSLVEIPFLPNRIMMHDTTCGPALVDIAAMRDVLAENGRDPDLLTPRIPVDVSTDHSSGVDVFGRPDAFRRNLEKEFDRNAERYRLMKWAASAMPGIRVHPPGSGIMHTINLERLSSVVACEMHQGEPRAFPDVLLGTDSHTPTVNGLGVLGWGVGGLEAEGALFGVPVVLRIPDVIGVKLTGRLRNGVLATDLALEVTRALRALGVTGDFVEFFGPGVSTLAVGERAAIANMAPEYGASTGYFPIDERSLAYLSRIGRSPRDRALVEAYAKAGDLWFDSGAEPRFTRSLTVDLDAIEASVAGPRRPQDRLPAGRTRSAFTPPLAVADGLAVPDGAVVIAAITSCTNTSDASLLAAAGVLARKARARGLKPPAYVKTSLAPGSPTAERFLRRAGLLDDLEGLGFGIVGYGCTTCIGNSGALLDVVSDALGRTGFRPVAVLSGNRNFPGRVHPDLENGFLASPPLVIAFALAGTVDIDITREPLGIGADGQPVMLREVWPTGAEIDEAVASGWDVADFDAAYHEAATRPLWVELDAPSGPRFPWDPASTYLRRPPFVREQGLPLAAGHARPLIVLGDDVTTDHISPANQIRPDSAAGRHIVAQGGDPADLNVFASRRGNFEVMIRGAFTNRLAVNRLLPAGTPAGFTRHEPSGEIVPLTEAAERYGRDGTPLVLVAGERYGMGSSRDWAAKAVALLGVRAVIAASIERIHRTNLIGMGILPLLLPEGVHPDRLDIRSTDLFEIDLGPGRLAPRCEVPLTIHRSDGEPARLVLRAAIETSLEITLLEAGGLIPHVLARLLRGRDPVATEGA
ncbi:aconitate hydratase AcnA [Bosea sp. (in: a-proteobacteria)]|uniref:aconitate hydratase AcnA n=1 Tax=Bosea sp. (in: a-proteobacteria) TaxID=1871050 RepID=UPI002DDD2566|nr:aconitate hydratase AcnA [Bosea sp. (in: a-proteobacteria)]HEV2512271.1 aconitate hydratase AcnA [Bosea sp. (in: a-proteobacteria)]